MRSRDQSTHAHKVMAVKVGKKKKGGWDNTLSDLSKHRLSPAEVERRRLSHVSKNLEAARKDLYERPKSTVASKSNVAMVTSSKNISTSSSQDTSIDFIMKGKYSKGHPIITPAPYLIENKENLERTLQELVYEGHPTAMTSPGGIRDDSLWKRLELPPPPTVLNEIPPHSTSPINNENEEPTNEDDPTYHPLINLQRYNDFVSCELTKVNKEVDPVTTLMHQLQVEVQEYEQEMGVVDSVPSQHTSSLECAVKTSLILVRYLRNAQRQLKEERTLQEQLLLTVEDQQSILDTMATDIVELKEKQFELENENKKLKEQLMELQKEMKREGRGYPPSHMIPMLIPGPFPHSRPHFPPPPHLITTTNCFPMGTNPTVATSLPIHEPIGGTTPLVEIGTSPIPTQSNIPQSSVHHELPPQSVVSGST